jgi:hypothetical protein
MIKATEANEITAKLRDKLASENEFLRIYENILSAISLGYYYLPGEIIRFESTIDKLKENGYKVEKELFCSTYKISW